MGYWQLGCPSAARTHIVGCSDHILSETSFADTHCFAKTDYCWPAWQMRTVGDYFTIDPSCSVHTG